MKFVQIDDETGAVSWDQYFEYLRRHKDAFPAQMYAYVSEWSHYSLDGKDSLHDAWIESIRFVRSESKPDGLEITLLGARHDRLHCLMYGGVRQLEIAGLEPCASGANDLIAHEFTVGESGFTHEMTFGDAARLHVKFCQFRYQKRSIKPGL